MHGHARDQIISGFRLPLDEKPGSRYAHLVAVRTMAAVGPRPRAAECDEGRRHRGSVHDRRHVRGAPLQLQAAIGRLRPNTCGHDETTAAGSRYGAPRALRWRGAARAVALERLVGIFPDRLREGPACGS